MKVSCINSWLLTLCLAFHTPLASAKLGESLVPSSSVSADEPSDLPPLNRVREEKGRSRHLTQLHSYGGDPGSQFMPLQLCEGDCDVDSDVSPEETRGWPELQTTFFDLLRCLICFVPLFISRLVFCL